MSSAEIQTETKRKMEKTLEILKEEFNLVKRVNFFTVCHLFLFRNL